jgi:BirA family biotin operon repressor/biotin-[acetyl-CoA-carboxylase] ligase
MQILDLFSSNKDEYTLKNIQKCLNKAQVQWAGKEVNFMEETDSTNLRAKAAAESGAPEGTLIISDLQTDGVGRRGRNWESPAETNIYMTLLLRPKFAVDKASMMTLLMALAVVDAIKETCGLEAMIKWPNDVVIGGKKVCGILTEMKASIAGIQYVNVGVGINVKEQEFSLEVQKMATALVSELDQKAKPPVRAKLIAAVMKAFEKYYAIFLEKGDLADLQEQYDSLLVSKEKEVRVLDIKGEYTGMAQGINANGELLVQREDGTVTAVYAGEVSVRGIYGYV